MSTALLSRRDSLRLLGTSVGLSVLPAWSQAKTAPTTPFTYCLNLSTIRGQKLGFVKELEVASKAGFRSVEIWMDTLEDYLKEGHSLKDAQKVLDDLGLKVENAIGFAQWIIDDDTERAKGVEQLKREMDMLAQLGCRRTAAPPAGATNTPGLDLKKAAERFRTIVELGEKTTVMPQLELWGFSKNLNKLSEVMYVATESGHPKARVLLDVYHLYKGGSSIDSLPLIGKPAIEIFHVNDYLASSQPATITDADRIYTGDGAAPIRKILESVRTPERPLVISFEVFNKNYYAQDPLLVAQTALSKMKAVTKGIG